MAQSKELRDLVKAINNTPGWLARPTKKGHIMVTKDGKPITTIGGTISDWRGMKNALADLRRAGWPH